MAKKVQQAGSDQEMLSQTETEDTDTGEVSSESATGRSTSSTESTQYSLTSTSSECLADEYIDEQRARKLTHVSVDLTDVTALEDNASQGGDSASSDARREEECTSNTNTRKNDKGQAKCGLSGVDFSTDWYNHECFKSYWQHYNQVMSWCGKHFQVCENLRKKSEGRARATGGHRFPSADPSAGPFSHTFQPPNSMYMSSWNHPYMYYQHETNTNVNVGRNLNGASPGNKSRQKKKKARHRKAKSVSSSEMTSCETQTETSEEFQMEITQDMIDFFAKTQAHRKERDEARKAERNEEATELEHINVEDVKVTETRTPTVQAPKERPGAKRTAEMKLLYGKGAAMIHGMETALQMTYDRNVDLKQPKTWPNMPLRVVFS